MKRFIAVVVLIVMIVSSLASCSNDSRSSDVTLTNTDSGANTAPDTESSDDVTKDAPAVADVTDDAELINDMLPTLKRFLSFLPFDYNFSESRGASEGFALQYFEFYELGDKTSFIKDEYKEYVLDDGFTVEIPKSIIREKLNNLLNVDYWDFAVGSYTLQRVSSYYYHPTSFSVEKATREGEHIVAVCRMSDLMTVTVGLEKNEYGYKILSSQCEYQGSDSIVNRLNGEDEGRDKVDQDVYFEIVKFLIPTQSTLSFEEGDTVPLDELIGYFNYLQLGYLDILFNDQYKKYELGNTLSALVPTEEVKSALEEKFKVNVDVSDSAYMTEGRKKLLVPRAADDKTVDFCIDDCKEENGRITVIFRNNDYSRTEIVGGAETYVVLTKEVVLQRKDDGSFLLISCRIIQV